MRWKTITALTLPLSALAAPGCTFGLGEVARFVESTDVPGWEAETWEGQPIVGWE